jgi:hypothetical protein
VSASDREHGPGGSRERNSESYLESLSRELDLVGIRGPRRRRIMTEFADHLACDPHAELGSPQLIARQFADELGTALARSAAFRAFAALALAGLLFGATVAAGTQFARVTAARASTPVLLSVVVCVIAAQVSFIAGGLGLVRGLRLRRASVIPTAEARVLVRRAAVGLGAGALTLLALPVVAQSLAGSYYATWRLLAYLCAGVGLIAIVLASPSVVAASRLVPQADGEPGDLFSDLGGFVPRWLADAPWRFALVVAGAVAFVTVVAGVAASDPYDAILRGLLEGAACLAGFAVLGRYLGLRRAVR